MLCAELGTPGSGVSFVKLILRQLRAELGPACTPGAAQSPALAAFPAPLEGKLRAQRAGHPTAAPGVHRQDWRADTASGAAHSSGSAGDANTAQLCCEWKG